MEHAYSATYRFKSMTHGRRILRVGLLKNRVSKQAAFRSRWWRPPGGRPGACGCDGHAASACRQPGPSMWRIALREERRRQPSRKQ